MSSSLVPKSRIIIATCHKSSRASQARLDKMKVLAETLADLTSRAHAVKLQIEKEGFNLREHFLHGTPSSRIHSFHVYHVDGRGSISESVEVAVDPCRV